MQLRRGQSPPSPRFSIQVFWVRTGPPQFFWLLCEAEEILTHYVQGRTRPCVLPVAQCPWHNNPKYPEIQSYYIPALWQDPNKPKGEPPTQVIFTLGKAAFDELEKPSRGLIVEAKRLTKPPHPGRPQNGKVIVSIHDRRYNETTPPAFDVIPILMHLWSIHQRPKRKETPFDDQAPKAEKPVILESPFRRKKGGAS
jgi:hypothetical protein